MKVKVYTVYIMKIAAESFREKRISPKKPLLP